MNNKKPTRNAFIDVQDSGAEVPKELADYPIIYNQPIHWGEMDAFSHLNNVVYYRYAESARIAYLQALGMFDGNMVTVLA